MDLMEKARRVLKATFGFEHFRGHQEEVIGHLLTGGDALVLMPTGGGKSLCYQIPALVREGTGVVISPLIALMQNQVAQLRQLGIRAEFLNSTLDRRTAAAVQTRLRRGEIDLLYVAPERLTMESTLDLLKQVPLSLFAVDEAHCISQWGHDFRKDYLELSLLHEQFPDVPRIALTATADERTRSEIVTRLGLGDCRVFVSSFNRANIHYRIAEKKAPREQLLAFIEEEYPRESGIVYCLARHDVERVATFLAAQGKTAIPYHAGLPAAVREEHLDRFLREDAVIVVATIAFGMGIDKPDVRFVAHLDLPRNLEAYYQETGRAGRDGQPATAWMVYGIGDVIALRQMLSDSSGNLAYKRVEFQKIQSMLGFCEVTTCRRQVLLAYFSEQLDAPCGNCDTCLSPVQTWDATVAAQMALSCIVRTGQRFGVNHLIDVLRGHATTRVTSLRHDQVSTFGIGTAHDDYVWRSVFRQLIAKGFVRVDDYGSLSLHPSAGPLLKSEVCLHLRQETRPQTTRKRRKSAQSKKTQAPRSDREQDLWSALVRYRQSAAREQNLPPYCIFQNATLDSIARLRPRTPAELLTVSGVGEVKLAKYGEGFLAVIRDWERQQGGEKSASEIWYEQNGSF